MNKFLGIVLPYIIIVFVGIMNTIEVVQKEIIIAGGFGILLGLWMIVISKCEGTVLMKLGIVFNIVMKVVAIVLGMTAIQVPILSQLIPTLIVLACVECAGYYMIHKNKPHLSMSYQYSYKNRRRRYF